MNYRKFISFNIIGGAIWIVLLLMAGYLFGSLDIVKNNFEKVILGIILVSVLPMIIEFFRQRRAKAHHLLPDATPGPYRLPAGT